MRMNTSQVTADKPTRWKVDSFSNQFGRMSAIYIIWITNGSLIHNKLDIVTCVGRDYYQYNWIMLTWTQLSYNENNYIKCHSK